MAVDTNAPRTRRNLLAAGLGGLAATVATAIGRPQLAQAATGDAVLAGVDTNAATSPTKLTNSGGNQVGFNVVSGAAGQINSVGVQGESPSGFGVLGATGEGIGVWGEGVYGVYATGAAGVVGDVDGGTGVLGWTGVDFAPDPQAKVGVWAAAETGRTALLVSGVARFTRSGKTSIAANKTSVTVTVAGGLGRYAFALATLQTNRAGVYVQAVVPNMTTSQITIYINKVASTTQGTAVGWIVIS